MINPVNPPALFNLVQNYIHRQIVFKTEHGKVFLEAGNQFGLFDFINKGDISKYSGSLSIIEKYMISQALPEKLQEVQKRCNEYWKNYFSQYYKKYARPYSDFTEKDIKPSPYIRECVLNTSEICINESYINELYKNYPNLLSFHFKPRPISLSGLKQLLAIFGEQMVQLTVQITHFDQLEILSKVNFNSLVRIDFSRSQVSLDEWLIALGERAPLLEHLTLAACNAFSSENLINFLLQKAEHLKSLDVSKTRFKGEALKAPLSALKQLAANSNSELNLEVFLPFCPQLERLILRYKKLSRENLMYIFQQMPNLKELDMSTSSMDAGDFENLVRSLETCCSLSSNLTFIDFSNTIFTEYQKNRLENVFRHHHKPVPKIEYGYRDYLTDWTF